MTTKNNSPSTSEKEKDFNSTKADDLSIEEYEEATIFEDFPIKEIEFLFEPVTVESVRFSIMDGYSL